MWGSHSPLFPRGNSVCAGFGEFRERAGGRSGFFVISEGPPANFDLHQPDAENLVADKDIANREAGHRRLVEGAKPSCAVGALDGCYNIRFR